MDRYRMWDDRSVYSPLLPVQTLLLRDAYAQPIGLLAPALVEQQAHLLSGQKMSKTVCLRSQSTLGNQSECPDESMGALCRALAAYLATLAWVAVNPRTELRDFLLDLGVDCRISTAHVGDVEQLRVNLLRFYRPKCPIEDDCVKQTCEQ